MAIIGDNIIRLEHVDSTNRYLREFLADMPNGTVVITKEQTAGRGRKDKSWISLPDKSLTFSVLLSQCLEEFSAPFFHLFPAVAVVQCLHSFDIPAQLKWPNDIYLFRQKIGGLLVQAVTNSDKIAVIIGIGINVLEEVSDFPETLRDHVGSIWSLAGKKIAIEMLFQAVLQELNAVYEQFQQPAKKISLHQLWRDYCMHINQNITIFQNDGKVSGKFVGLEDNGFAVIETANGKLIINDYDYVSMRDEHDSRN